MRARPGATYHYESSLIQAISDRNLSLVTYLIAGIEKFHDHKPSLTMIDQNGVNLLSFALDIGLGVMVKVLLDTGVFDNEPDILFSVNSAQQTLICQSVTKGYTDIAERFLQLTEALQAEMDEEALKQSLGYRIWSKPDDKGNTPLHYAVMQQQRLLCSRLFKLLAADAEGIIQINHQNEQGNTPLHVAMRQGADAGLVDELLTGGADMSQLNHDRQTPFGLLCQRDVDDQLKFLLQLNQKNQLMVLELYKAYLTTHPANESISQVYYKMMGSRRSLTDLMIAHLEFNPYVKPRNYYYESVREEGMQLILMYNTIPSGKLIKPGILYLYLDDGHIKIAGRNERGRIERIQIDNDLRSENDLPIRQVLEDPAHKKALEKKDWEVLAEVAQFYGYPLLIPPYKVQRVKKYIDHTQIENQELAERLPLYLSKLSSQGVFGFTSQEALLKPYRKQVYLQDKDTLSNLIADIEVYLRELTAHKPIENYKIMSIAIPLLAWLVYGGIQTWLIVSAVHEGDQLHYGYNGKLLPVYQDTDHQGEFCFDDRYHRHPHPHHGYDGHYSDWDYCETIVPFPYYWTSLGFGAAGAVLNFTLSFLPTCLWDKPPSDTVFKFEWRACLEALQQEVIVKLEALQDDDLPVGARSLNDTVDVISQLNAEWRKPRADVIALLTRLTGLLNQMRDDLEKSHKPFSATLFAAEQDHREVAIEIPSFSDSDTSFSSDDEAQPLLSHNEPSPLVGRLGWSRARSAV